MNPLQSAGVRRRAWGVGALLALPVFDGGRRAAGVQSANAQWDAAAAGYREQVLVAFREVEDQLSALRLLAEQAGAQARAVDSGSAAQYQATVGLIRALGGGWDAQQRVGATLPDGRHAPG